MYKSFKDMPVWVDAVNLAEDIFHMTENLPRKEDYGFTSQIRRAALSMSANIAEAYGRYHTMDKLNFYYFCRGSITETQSHIEYGLKVNYISKNDYELINEKLDKLLLEINKIILTLKRNHQPSSIPQPQPQPQPQP